MTKTPCIYDTRGCLYMKRGISSKRTAKKISHKNEIDAAIAEGLKDIAAGRESGPFSTIAEFHAHLRKRIVRKPIKL